MRLTTENYTEPGLPTGLTKEANSAGKSKYGSDFRDNFTYINYGNNPVIKQKNTTKNRRARYLFTCTVYVMLSFLLWLLTAPGIRTGNSDDLICLALCFIGNVIRESENNPVYIFEKQLW